MIKSFALACAFFLVSTQAFAINCHGTEPFWGAEITSDQVVYESPDLTEPMTYSITSVGAAAGYVSDFIQIYQNNNGPVAIVKNQTCSDGMSDFDYPKEVIIFTGTATLYGCCGVGTPAVELPDAN